MSNDGSGGGPPPGGYGGFGLPPAGGFGAAPPGGYGHDRPPVHPQPYLMGTAPRPAVQGSFGLGFCAGFFGGCIGALLVYALAKGHQTKRGAGIGFAVQILLGAVARALR